MSIVWPQDETSTNSRPLSGSQAATRRFKEFLLEPYKRRFAAVMAQVRRPVPFRTRKLRPGTAMVLHSTGCGRVARRRITRTGSPDTLKVPGLPSYRDARAWGVYLASLGLSVLGLTPPGPPRRQLPSKRKARNWLGYGVALHWLLLCITSPLNVALRRIKSCITIRRRFSVPLIKA